MQRACSDIPTFTENWSGTLAAEYLLTVRVASALRDLNQGIGFPFKVYIEERTQNFVRKCIPIWPVNSDVLIRKQVYRAVKRKGKIDIGVTHDSSPNAQPIPVCVIEIKGFDPALKEIRKDLVRNANFMKVGELVGQYGMFTSLIVLHEGDAVTPKSKDVDFNRIRKLYDREVRRIRSRLRGVEVHYEVFTAGEEFPDREGQLEEFEHDEELPDHFVGAIVTFYRINSEPVPPFFPSNIPDLGIHAALETTR
jgi:hypothetical protein